MAVPPRSVRALTDIDCIPHVIVPDAMVSADCIHIVAAANSLRLESILSAGCLDPLTYNVDPVASSRFCRMGFLNPGAQSV